MNSQKITKEIKTHALKILKICEKNKIDYLDICIIDNNLFFHNSYWQEKTKINYKRIKGGANNER